MAEYLIQEETLGELADAVRNASGRLDKIVSLLCKRDELEMDSLPEGLKTIRQYAFDGCANLALTSLPSTLTTIEYGAFWSCSNLKIAYLPDELSEIRPYAFASCSSIETLSIPGQIRILFYAFANCWNLKTVTFRGRPEYPTDISEKTFDNCPNLTTINVPWSEGTVSGAPWGATNATINYGYTGGGTE